MQALYIEVNREPRLVSFANSNGELYAMAHHYFEPLSLIINNLGEYHLLVDRDGVRNNEKPNFSFYPTENMLYGDVIIVKMDNSTFNGYENMTDNEAVQVLKFLHLQ